MERPKTMHREPIPVKPAVLAWAISESGYPASHVAERLGISVETLTRRIRGDEQPSLTHTKLRQLAALLKRAPSALLLPRPPERKIPSIQFRHPLTERRGSLNPTELRYIREAARIQRILSWVLAEIGERWNPPAVKLGENVEEVAKSTRARLRVNSIGEMHWKTGSEAFANWRLRLEENGFLIFLLPLGGNSCRGFSLWDSRAPVIAISTAWRTEARIFSLFHEYAHLLTRTDSACLETGFHKSLSPMDDEVERWCEQLSAAILIPKDEVLRQIESARGNVGSGLSLAMSLANRFRVSLRAAVIRLIELHQATWDLYREIPQSSDQKTASGGGKGRTRLRMREDWFGHRATDLFRRAVEADVLSRTDVLGILNVADSDFDLLQSSRDE